MFFNTSAHANLLTDGSFCSCSNEVDIMFSFNMFHFMVRSTTYTAIFSETAGNHFPINRQVKTVGIGFMSWNDLIW